MNTVRLDRLLRELGLGTRSQIGQTVRSGRVLVDGRAVTDPGTHVREGQRLVLDGTPLDTKRDRHLMMYKPQGLLSAARDRSQETVFELLPPLYLSLGCMPVGRLDKDTEGLLLFTSDGVTAHRLLSPKLHVEKEYLARVTGRLAESSVRQFREGLSLAGTVCLPAKLELLRAKDDESLALVTLCEGKYRQVRRMFDSLGHPVTFLKRVRFGPLRLDEHLSPGMYRELSAWEWDLLRKAVV